jgi:monovalent cation:H+ antiporter, CPA1 family
VTAFQILAALLTMAAVFGWLNHRFFGLPRTIALMAMSLFSSLVLVGLDALGLKVTSAVGAVVGAIDFDETVLQGLLGALLFAGALHVDLADLRRERLAIGMLAIGGTLISTILVGGLAYLVLDLIGLPLPLIWCLVFGALISPTDPIAVLGVLKSAGAPRALGTQIAGESLFNDGVGVVIFLAVVGVATGGSSSAGHVMLLFAKEAVGGTLFGVATGYVAFHMLKSINSHQVEVLITLALVTGGYAAASALHVSAPIAAVVAGLYIGNHGRRLAMSDNTRQHLDAFWELVDEVLNSVLFVLIGVEMIVIQFTSQLLAAGGILIVAVLVARFGSVALPLAALRGMTRFPRGTLRVMTWGGLRGGISVALALTLPPGHTRDVILGVTYIIVVFSVLVQGLTLRLLLKRLGMASEQIASDQH